MMMNNNLFLQIVLILLYLHYNVLVGFVFVPLPSTITNYMYVIILCDLSIMQFTHKILVLADINLFCVYLHEHCCRLDHSLICMRKQTPTSILCSACRKCKLRL